MTKFIITLMYSLPPTQIFIPIQLTFVHQKGKNISIFLNSLTLIRRICKEELSDDSMFDHSQCFDSGI